MTARISKLLHLSNSHLQPSTADWLDNQPIYSTKHENGWFVWVEGDLAIEGVPAELVTCIEYALERGCDWICFDRDEKEVSELALFDWD